MQITNTGKDTIRFQNVPDVFGAILEKLDRIIFTVYPTQYTQ